MFIVSLTYTASLDLVDELLTSHVNYLNEQYSKGTFLLSGRKVPRTGGVILATAESREKLEAILSEDPFWENQVAKFEIIEFMPTKSAEGLELLLK